MSADSSVALLRAHDPAVQLAPLGVPERDKLREEILSTPPTRTQSRSARRRLAVALAVGVGALLFAAAGWAVYQSVFQSSAQVRDDFAVWTQRIELPPGAAWLQPNLDEQSLYGGRAAEMIALGQATCAWFTYWEDGYKARAVPRMRDAVEGFLGVRAVMPAHPAGANEEVGGYGPQVLAYYDRVIEQQHRGIPQLTEQYLLANCR